MAVLLTPPVLQFFDNNGDPLVNGKLRTFVAGGTTTKKATFTDAAESAVAQNPIILDSAGRAVVWISGSYCFQLEDALGNIIRTVDNVTSFNAIAATAPSYFQSFSGNGVQTAFTLSTDLGTDENAIQVFVDNGTPNQILNGTFDTDTIWTKGAGWTIASGVATATGAISTDLSQAAAIALIPGQAYSVTYTITRSAGTITPNLGGQVGVGRALSGTYTEIISAGATQNFAFNTAGFTGTVDVVSISLANGKGREVLNPSEYTLTNTVLTLAQAPKTGNNNVLVFAPSLLVGAASASAAQAESFANAAGLSATAAANSAASLRGTSTTSNTVGAGLKSFVTQQDKNFSVGAFLLIASAANVSTYMFGQINSYDPVTGALTVGVGSAINQTGNAGTTVADWILQICGVQGVPGTIGSGTAEMKSQIFTTPAGLTQFTLTNTPVPASASALFIHFDGTIQQPTEWTLNVGTGVITFSSPIPIGVNQVYCHWFKDIAVGTPTDGTVTYPKFDAGVLGALADLVGNVVSKIPTVQAVVSYVAQILAGLYLTKAFFLGQAGATAVNNRIAPTVVQTNRGGAMAVGTGIFTAPHNGDYFWSISMVAALAGTVINVRVNGAVYWSTTIGAANYVASYSGHVPVSASDQIDFYVTTQASGSTFIMSIRED